MKIMEAVKPEDIHIGCLNCPTAQRVAHLDTIICVGFGSAQITKDGLIYYDGEQDFRDGKEPLTLRTIEDTARNWPDSDWRCIMHGPLHGETYQRQPITADLKCGPLDDDHTSKDKRFAWIMVESNQGFA